MAEEETLIVPCPTWPIAFTPAGPHTFPPSVVDAIFARLYKDGDPAIADSTKKEWQRDGFLGMSQTSEDRALTVYCTDPDKLRIKVMQYLFPIDLVGNIASEPLVPWGDFIPVYGHLRSLLVQEYVGSHLHFDVA